MKNIFYGIAVVIIFICSSCPFPAQEHYSDPEANLGFYDNQQVIQIVDPYGQSFLVSKILYQQLFNSGGYNNLIHFQHDSPMTHGFYQSYDHSKFKLASDASAQQLQISFMNSYQVVYNSHNVYSPRKRIDYYKAQNLLESKSGRTKSPSDSSMNPHRTLKK